jgi:O-antigen/teichoic acid export membrane protein
MALRCTSTCIHWSRQAGGQRWATIGRFPWTRSATQRPTIMTDVHTRAKQGIKLLMGRQFILQILTFAGGVVLARVLGPAQFGLYAIASFLVAAFALFGDFGLAPSLIQRKEQLTDSDLSVAFTLQQILTTTIVVILLIFAPWLAHFYPKAPPETVWIVRALAFNLFLTSWRTMSALQLERRLDYQRLAKIEVVESLTYQGMAVLLAVTGHGVWSYVDAIFVSSILGTLLVYGASPWKIRFSFDRRVAEGILRFGVPFQLQSIVNSVGGWVTPILVGSLIGPQAVGYLTWASSNGKKPLVLVDNVMRVAFPHFSRLQDDADEVQRTIVRYLTWLLLPSGLWFAVIVVSGPSLIDLIYTPKWLPAATALALCAGALSMDVMSWVVGVSLNSIGKVAFVTKVVMVRNIGSIVCSVALVLLYGFIGVPIGYLIASVLVVPWLLRGLGPRKMSETLRDTSWTVLPVVAAIVVGEIDIRLCHSQLMSAITSVLSVTTAYIACIWLVGPKSLKDSIRRQVLPRGINFGEIVSTVE